MVIFVLDLSGAGAGAPRSQRAISLGQILERSVAAFAPHPRTAALGGGRMGPDVSDAAGPPPQAVRARGKTSSRAAVLFFVSRMCRLLRQRGWMSLPRGAHGQALRPIHVMIAVNRTPSSEEQTMPTYMGAVRKSR